MRHKLRGWDLDASFDFGRRGPRLALAKSLRHATLSASWDVHEREAGLEYAHGAVRLGARLGRGEAAAGGGFGAGWKRPSLYLQLEPLSLL